MNDSFDREHQNLLVAGFVVDNLAPEEAEELQDVLLTHPELANEIDDMQDVLHQLLDGLSEVEPPPQLLANILEHADASEPAPLTVHGDGTVLALQRGGLLKRWPWLAAGLAAVAVGTLGMDYYRLHQRLGVMAAENQRLREANAQAQVIKTLLKAPETQRFTFKNVGLPQAASGSIVMNSELRKAIMLVQDLPEPPTGQAYVLWVVVASEKVPCGEIKPYTWTDGSYELPFTPEMYQDFYNPKLSGLMVTLEESPNVARPEGPVVMQGTRI